MVDGVVARTVAHRLRVGGSSRTLRGYPATGDCHPLHVHHREAEAFYLLEGSMTYREGEDVFRPESGDLIYLPVDVPPAFRITGSSPAR